MRQVLSESLKCIYEIHGFFFYISQAASDFSSCHYKYQLVEMY